MSERERERERNRFDKSEAIKHIWIKDPHKLFGPNGKKDKRKTEKHPKSPNVSIKYLFTNPMRIEKERSNLWPVPRDDAPFGTLLE